MNSVEILSIYNYLTHELDAPPQDNQDSINDKKDFTSACLGKTNRRCKDLR